MDDVRGDATEEIEMTEAERKESEVEWGWWSEWGSWFWRHCSVNRTWIV